MGLCSWALSLTSLGPFPPRKLPPSHGPSVSVPSETPLAHPPPPSSVARCPLPWPCLSFLMCLGSSPDSAPWGLLIPALPTPTKLVDDHPEVADGRGATYGPLCLWPVTPGLLYLAHSYHYCSVPLLCTLPC